MNIRFIAVCSYISHHSCLTPNMTNKEKPRGEVIAKTTLSDVPGSFVNCQRQKLEFYPINDAYWNRIRHLVNSWEGMGK